MEFVYFKEGSSEFGSDQSSLSPVNHQDSGRIEMAVGELVHIRKASELDVPLNRDIFTRTLIRELAGTLEEVVGLKEAAGFVSVVGQNIGNQMNADYKAAFGVNILSREQVRDVLVDLKRRIQGDFFVIEEDEGKIVLGNRVCPFEDKVLGRRSMCMMTSNVFGSIAAENLGYAKVELQQTIASGDGGCRVVVYLRPGAEADAVEGREYFKSLE
jgi:Methanogen output domain 1